MYKILISTIFTFFISLSAYSQETISIDSVAQFKGHHVKVCAKVMGTYVTNSEKQVTYLNLGAPYPSPKLTVVIFNDKLINFANVPSDFYKDQDVCVVGKIKEYKERMKIILNKEDEIELVK